MINVFISSGKLKAADVKIKAADMKFLPIKEPPRFEEVDISDNIEQLDGEIKNCVIDLQGET